MNELRLGITVEALRLLLLGETIAMEFDDPKLNLRVVLRTTDEAQQSIEDHIQHALLMRLDPGPEMH